MLSTKVVKLWFLASNLLPDNRRIRGNILSISQGVYERDSLNVVRLLLVFRQYLKTYHHPYNQCEKSTSCGFNNLLIMFVKSWIRLVPALVLKYFSALLIISLLIFTIASLFLSSRKYNNNASMCDCFRYQKGRGILLLMISSMLFITPSLFLW
jgi:hypothetical protein